MKSLLPLSLSLALALSLAACVSPPAPVVTGPVSATPVVKPAQVERPITGSLFQADAPVTSLFSVQKPPRLVGDTLKIDIAEVLSASTKLNTETSRENSLAVKGPGESSSAPPGILRTLLNLDAKASGTDSFKGSGSTDQTTKFNGKIAVTVVNVLANGNLVVAGERAVAYNQGVTTLRFSGIVNPADVGLGNVVASSDVVNARLEAIGEGGVAETTSRSWLQRVLAKTFQVW